MPAPKNPNTAAATAAVRRKAQDRKAAELRKAGWTVVPPDGQKAGEELVVLAAVLIARANPRTLRSGNSHDRIMVDLSVLRRMEAAVEVASPGALVAIRAATARSNVRRTKG